MSKMATYKALISSDWNQCLAPCGPFDVITFTYPELSFEIDAVFKNYTGNHISLGTAVTKINSLLPGPISIEQMDCYLNHSFETYSGVADLIEWSLSKDLLFMINTTGPIGYFQRVFAKKLLPKVPVLAANPIIHYPFTQQGPFFHELRETSEKGKYTSLLLQLHKIPSNKTIIIGDSGGDGPHFEWAEKNSVYKIASMTKPSLLDYCSLKNVEINLSFGLVYGKGDQRDQGKEMAVDFLQLRSIFEQILF
jgi:hypothetical protein